MLCRRSRHFNQNHAHIAHHASSILRTFSAGDPRGLAKLDFVDLGHALDDVSDLFSNCSVMSSVVTGVSFDGGLQQAGRDCG